MAEGPKLVTLTEIAERANEDADFFEAVVEHATNPNAALAPYEMRLSTQDADRLRAGLSAIKAVDLEFQQFGGWGRWPRFDF